MKRSDIKKTIIFTALVFVMTLSGALMPLSDGTYIHIGDAAVYVAALMLPTPLACIASAIGAGFSDILLGSWVYLIPTLIIKPLTVLACKLVCRISKDQSVSDLLVCGAGIVTVVGYFVSQLIIERSTASALEGITFNCVQALASAVVFFILVNAVRRITDKIKKRAEKKQEEQNESSDL